MSRGAYRLDWPNPTSKEPLEGQLGRLELATSTEMMEVPKAGQNTMGCRCLHRHTRFSRWTRNVEDTRHTSTLSQYKAHLQGRV